MVTGEVGRKYRYAFGFPGIHSRIPGSSILEVLLELTGEAHEAVLDSGSPGGISGETEER